MQALDRLHRWLVHQPLLWSFTTFTRVALAIGFLPSGMTKVLGRPFTQLDPETSAVGYFFDAFFQAEEYYAFVGIGQVLAAVLLLVPRFSFLGAVLYLPIIANIFVITASIGFRGTWLITLLMLCANVYLLFWDWERVRAAFFPGAPALASSHRPAPEALPAGCSWRTRLLTAGICMFAAASWHATSNACW